MSYESSHTRSTVVTVVAILALLGSSFLLLAPHAKTRPEEPPLATLGFSNQSTVARTGASDRSAASDPTPIQQQYNLTSDGQ
jgi:hypothetical protein